MEKNNMEAIGITGMILGIIIYWAGILHIRLV